MVSGPRTDAGTSALPFRVIKTIQSIREVVGKHSDTDSYSMLKEANMDPNETSQKLLHQDPFHEVKWEKDKKNENLGNSISSETKIQYEHSGPLAKPQAMWDRNGRKAVYSRNASRGVSHEFRVVRDNRVNQNVGEGVKSASIEHAISNQDQVVPGASDKSSSAAFSNQKRSDTRSSELQLLSHGFSGARDSFSSRTHDTDLSATRRLVLVGEKRAIVPRSGVQILGQRSNNSSPSSTLAASKSVVGVYSKSTDPVHVPSPDSRSSGSIGAIKREVGVVGVRRQSTHPSESTVRSSTFSLSDLGKDSARPADPVRHTFTAHLKSDQLNQPAATHTPNVNMSSNRTFLGNHQSGRLQQTVGHQKALQPNMEWKPKSNQKLNVPGPGVIGKSAISVSSPADNSSVTRMEHTDLPEKLSQVNLSADQHVIIPQHLQVPEADRSRLTFGSFGVEVDSSCGFGSGLQAFNNTEELKDEPAVSMSNPIDSNDNNSGGDGVDLLEDHGRISRSESPASYGILEASQPVKNDSPSHNLSDYSNIGLVRSQSPACGPVEMQQHQDPGTLSSFSGYDSQFGYEVPFYKPAMNDNIRQGLASPHEALGSHIIVSGPPSTANLVQQQQSVTQLYPQVHISHFPNFIPYRQMFPPVYVPPMAVPSFSSNPAYPHPSNGNSYLVMQGGSSHMTTGNMKYAPSQYKGGPAGGPVGYGNFTNPAGYTISTPGTVGFPTSLEDVSRIKYKDGNIYVPNPQAETSEIRIQNPRELSSMQPSPYYSMSGQAPHAAYMPSHAGPTSYNTPAVQSAHMPFPGLYHPPQAATIANPHPLVHQQLPGMGGNVPGAQVGAYQQPQLGHINWTSNF